MLRQKEKIINKDNLCELHTQTLKGVVYLSFINGYLSFWESILVNDRRVLWYFHTLLKTTTKENEISKRKKDGINKKTNE